MRILRLPPPQSRLSLLGLDDDMINYRATLNPVLENIHRQVEAALPTPLGGYLHPFQPGDWVVVKDLRRKHWDKPRWLGPSQVLLTTPTAVKVTGREMLIHGTHCRLICHSGE